MRRQWNADIGLAGVQPKFKRIKQSLWIAWLCVPQMMQLFNPAAAVNSLKNCGYDMNIFLLGMINRGYAKSQWGIAQCVSF